MKYDISSRATDLHYIYLMDSNISRKENLMYSHNQTRRTSFSSVYFIAWIQWYNMASSTFENTLNKYRGNLAFSQFTSNAVFKKISSNWTHVGTNLIKVFL